jgi:hypothetical protein
VPRAVHVDESKATKGAAVLYRSAYEGFCMRLIYVFRISPQVQTRLMTTCSLFLSFNSKFTKALHALTNEVEEVIASGGEWESVSIEQQSDFLNKFEVNL